MKYDLKTRLFANVVQSPGRNQIQLPLPDHDLPGLAMFLTKLLLAFAVLGLLLFGAM